MERLLTLDLPSVTPMPTSGRTRFSGSLPPRASSSRTASRATHVVTLSVGKRSKKIVDAYATSLPHHGRALQVFADGQAMGSFESDPDSEFTTFELEADDVQSISLQAVDLDDDDWLSLLEVGVVVSGRGG